ncbi:phosphoribosylformylglycinamidine cyclo-ligase [candidate division WOR-3 bacterium]|nr:phosphoribosylformylglycinamidine cyclo-ligase [candidate division WOR-3 bacterium]
MLYKNSGVDIDRLNLVRKGIGKEVIKTYRSNIRSTFGLFGGLYPLDDEYLVSSVDSVGTKILVACGADKHDTIGADIVNHCVNDILTTGARPLFFMDYIGFSDIEDKVLLSIIKGLARACVKEKMVLVGGETACLTRFYPKGIYDLVGFIVGRVAKSATIDTSRIAPGNMVIGFPSSGLHTNGYSLARKILLRQYTFSSRLPELRGTLGEELLKSHRSYRKILEPRLKYIKGLAHITGGGFIDNIKRILPKGCTAIVRKDSWDPLPIFKIIQHLGKVPEAEMYRVFNMGIGMVAIIDEKHQRLFKTGRKIGEIIAGVSGVEVV